MFGQVSVPDPLIYAPRDLGEGFIVLEAICDATLYVVQALKFGPQVRPALFQMSHFGKTLIRAEPTATPGRELVNWGKKAMFPAQLQGHFLGIVVPFKQGYRVRPTKPFKPFWFIDRDTNVLSEVGRFQAQALVITGNRFQFAFALNDAAAGQREATYFSVVSAPALGNDVKKVFQVVGFGSNQVDGETPFGELRDRDVFHEVDMLRQLTADPILPVIHDFTKNDSRRRKAVNMVKYDRGRAVLSAAPRMKILFLVCHMFYHAHTNINPNATPIAQAIAILAISSK